MRVIGAVLWPTARAVRWWPLLLALALGFGVLSLALRPKEVGDVATLVNWLRLVALLAALGTAFLLDDPSEPTTEAAGVSLLTRRLVRVGLAAPLLAGWWALVLWLAGYRLPGLDVPVAAATVQLGALLAVVLALAAFGARLAPERLGGVVAGPALAILAAAATELPRELALYVAPTSPEWEAARWRWTGLAVLGGLALLAGCRDPAARRVFIRR